MAGAWNLTREEVAKVLVPGTGNQSDTCFLLITLEIQANVKRDDFVDKNNFFFLLHKLNNVSSSIYS